MPPKTRGAKGGKAKNHVFATTKSTKKSRGSKAAAKSGPDNSAVSTDDLHAIHHPKKKARTKAPAQPKKRTGLLDLPPEIRLMIYRYALATDGPARINIHRGKADKRGPNARVTPKRGRVKARYVIKCCEKTSFETTYVAHSHFGCCPTHQLVQWSLMWVCSIIRKEAMPLMFEKCIFIASGLDSFFYFLKDLIPDQRESIRHVILENRQDETIEERHFEKWNGTFKYLAENLQLKTLSVEACSWRADLEDMIWTKRDRSLFWLNELCKMRNLDAVDIEIKVYEPEIGHENWVDWISEDSELDFDGGPDYDPCWDWVTVYELSEDITWHVAEKVLSKQALEKRKKNRAGEWEGVLERREVMKEIMHEFDCGCDCPMCPECDEEANSEHNSLEMHDADMYC